MSASDEEYLISLRGLGNAKIIYNSAVDTLHIVIDEEEADKAILLENNIIVRIKNGRVIEIEIQDVSKIIQE
jgi:hypothetical protein|uniref:DUF2283 domain-containing protein n=1 Tax=Ignisphaera aggregans TaxID=334771 RepID=A0A7J2TBL2_9CREN